MFDEYGNNGQCKVSNVVDIPKVDLSYLENVSEQAKILSIEGGQENVDLNG